MTGTPQTTTLNLLSKILEYEFGESRLRHYGIFADSSASQSGSANDLLLAQQRFAAQLREMVERGGPGAEILIVGDSLLPLAKTLAEADCSVAWIGSKSLLDGEFEVPASLRYAGDDFVASIEPSAVDVLVHEGSILYLDQLAILSKCRDVLGDKGQLIVFGEFIVDDSRIEHSSLPNLSSFKNLSSRLGFAQLENIDLSSSAMRTLESLRPLVQKHSSSLVKEGIIEAAALQAFCDEFHAIQTEFDSGRRGFHLFLLARDRDASNEWANAEFGDSRAFQPRDVADLFEKSFNVPFDEQLWNWKYAQGDGKCVVARLEKHSEVVAHYGGAPRKISYFGEPSMAIQPCDVMVHPSIRKQYGKGSLFFEVAATFLEREIGNTVNHLLGFGFPNQKAMNISTRLGLYEKTDDFVEVVYPVLSEVTQPNQYAIEDYDAKDGRSREAINQLWSLMRADYADGIIGVRDADYIQYRYIDHPFAKAGQYRCLLVREIDSGEISAFAVLKQHADGKLLMDLICPIAVMKPVIITLNQAVSGGEAGEILRAWVTKSGSDKLCIDGAIVNELGIEIPCNSWNPGPSAELLYGAWWLTAGDMDFV